MDIRRGEEKDYKELMGLYNLFVKSDRYSRYDNDSFARVRQNPNNFVFVAEDEGKLVGFISFSIRDVIRYPKQIMELDEIFVLQDYREKGVGKILMDQMETIAKEKNCHRIFIESHYDHKGAHKFYETLGYANYGYHFIKDM